MRSRPIFWMIGFAIFAGCAGASGPLLTSEVRARDSLIGIPAEYLPACLGKSAAQAEDGDRRSETYVMSVPGVQRRSSDPNGYPTGVNKIGVERRDDPDPRAGTCRLTFRIREQQVQDVEWTGERSDGLTHPACIEDASFELRTCVASRQRKQHAP
jgi:hypothetical protein